jgi:transglutaminase-like putative cysteine protease
MKYEVQHRTTYSYGEPVTLGHNEAHLTPRDFHRQQCLSNRLMIMPVPAVTRTWTDYFGNPTTFFTLEEEHRELSITAISEVEILAGDLPAAALTPPWESVRAALAQPSDAQHLAAAHFTFDSPRLLRHDLLGEYAAVSFTPGRPILDAALDLTGRIHGDFKYDPRATCVSTPTLEVFENRRGVCQDFAHLQIACLRSLGLAARYVSGYLLTDRYGGQPKPVGADASHAWLSVFCGVADWVDIDPTNNAIPTTRHITLAWGRDYGDVCPIKGVVVGGGRHAMSVAVDVVPAEIGH